MCVFFSFSPTGSPFVLTCISIFRFFPQLKKENPSAILLVSEVRPVPRLARRRARNREETENGTDFRAERAGRQRLLFRLEAAGLSLPRRALLLRTLFCTFPSPSRSRGDADPLHLGPSAARFPFLAFFFLSPRSYSHARNRSRLSRSYKSPLVVHWAREVCARCVFLSSYSPSGARD